MGHIPSPARALRWFDPRARQAGSWAFILNRLSGIGLGGKTCAQRATFGLHGTSSMTVRCEL